MFFCYPELIEACNKRTKSRKGLISYYKTNGITCLKGHVNVNHVVIYKKFENVVNNFFEKKCGETTSDKMSKRICMGHQYLIFLLPKTLVNKTMLNNNNFWRIVFYRLLKITYQYSLLKVYGWKGFVCIYVLECSFDLEKTFQMMFY